MLSLVAALALLHATPQAEDAPLELPVGAAPAPELSNTAYRAQLNAEVKREEANMPSAVGFAGGAALIGMGAASTVLGLGSGGAWSQSSGFNLSWGFNPITTGGYVAIGLGIASMVAGTVWMIALGVARLGPGQRIRALEYQLAAIQERQERQAEAAADARLTPAARELKATRPSFALPITLMLGGGVAIGVGTLLALLNAFPTPNGSFVGAGFVAVSMVLLAIGLVAETIGIMQLVSRRRQALEIDRQIDAMPPAQPSAQPTPAGSLLPPVPVLVGFTWPI